MSTFTNHVATEGQQVFTISFPYLDITHVRVMRNGVLCLIPGDYEWISATTFRMREPQPAGTLIQIRRFTQDNALVTYQNSATLTAEDLNVATLQNLYRTQELQDQINNYVESAVIRFASGGVPGQLTPEQLVAAAAQEILNSELLAALQERIGDIDINAESIMNQITRLDTMQSVVDALTDVEGGGLATIVANEQNARIAGDQALVDTLALIGAKSGDNLSFILDLNKVKVGSSETLASRFSSITSTATSNATTAANAAAANAAAIVAEQTARANGDSANATSITNLSATVTGNYSTLNALIGTEQTARANGDSALASSLTALGTTVTNNYNTLSSAVSSEITARSSGDSTNASAITALASTVSTNLSTVNAAIASEASTRASADTANASAITTLQATVNGVSASLSTVATVVNGAGGLSAQYMVKTDVNGYVSGYGLYNTGASSEFIVLADKFAVVTPGESPKVPFVITGGVCYMQDVVITNALIQNLTITKLTTGSLNADMNMGTGRIICTDGTVMEVMGSGFGSSNQFIRWTGPYSSNLNDCTEANALAFLRKDGLLFTGGAIVSGAYRNSTTGTLTASNADHEMTGVGTAGGPIVVAASYNFYGKTIYAPGASGTTPQNPSATLVLSRKVGTGSYSDVATFSPANVSYVYDAPNSVDPGLYEQFATGSVTYTDSAGGTGDRSFRLRLTARSTHTTVQWQQMNITTSED